MPKNVGDNAQRKRKVPSSSSPPGIQKTKQLKSPIVSTVNLEGQSIPKTSSNQLINDCSSKMDSSHYPESNAIILKDLLPPSSGGNKKQTSNYSVGENNAIDKQLSFHESSEIDLSIKQNLLIENIAQGLLDSQHFTNILVPDEENSMSVGPIEKNGNTTLFASASLNKLPGIGSQNQTVSSRQDSLPVSNLSTASPGGATYASVAEKNKFIGIPVKNRDLETKLSPSLGVSINRAPNTTIADYADAIAESIGEANLSHISPVSGGRAIAFVTNVTHAQSLVVKGLVVKGQLVLVSHLRPPATKIVLSNVYPIISRGDVIRAMAPYGNVIPTSFRDIKASTRQKDILSFRKEVLFIPKPNVQLPSAVVINAFDYKITVYISTEGLRCSTCSRVGHPASKCLSGNGNPVMTMEPTTITEVATTTDAPMEGTKVLYGEASLPAMRPVTSSDESVAITILSPTPKSVLPAMKNAVNECLAEVFVTEEEPGGAVLVGNRDTQLSTTNSKCEVSQGDMELGIDGRQGEDQKPVGQALLSDSQNLSLPVTVPIVPLADLNFSPSASVDFTVSHVTDAKSAKSSICGDVSPAYNSSDEREEDLSDVDGSLGSMTDYSALEKPLTSKEVSLLVNNIHGVRKKNKRRSIILGFTLDISGLYEELLEYKKYGLLWCGLPYKDKRIVQSVLDHLINTVTEMKTSREGFLSSGLAT